MHSSLAARDVDLCLIPEVDFYLHGEGGVVEFVQNRLRTNKHAVRTNHRQEESIYPTYVPTLYIPGVGASHRKEESIYLEREPITGGGRVYNWIGS